MIKSYLAEKKIGLNYFFVLLLVLNSSGIFFRNYTDYTLIFSFCISLFVFLFRKIKFDRYFVFLVLFYFLWYIFVIFKYQLVSPITYAGFFIRIFYVYFTLKIVKDELFPLFVRIVCHLSVICLVLFAAGILLPSFIYTVYHMLAPYQQLFSTDRSDGVSLFIYAYQLSKLNRNFGFMWEPGAYAGILIIAMMIYLALHQGKTGKHFWVFFIALVSTFSTMGYLGLFIVAFYKIYLSRMAGKVIYIVLSLLFLVYIYNLEFITKKFTSQFESYRYERSIDKAAAPSRFKSIAYDLEDFKENFLIGVGLSDETRYKGHLYYSAATSGITDYLLKFGIVGFVVLLFNLRRSFRFFEIKRRVKASLYIVTAILVVSVSEAFLYLPLFWAFQFYQFAGGKPIGIIEKSYAIND